VNGVAVITPGERMVVQFPDMGTTVAATDASPDVDATGSVSPSDAQQ